MPADYLTVDAILSVPDGAPETPAEKDKAGRRSAATMRTVVQTLTTPARAAARMVEPVVAAARTVARLVKAVMARLRPARRRARRRVGRRLTARATRAGPDSSSPSRLRPAFAGAGS